MDIKHIVAFAMGNMPAIGIAVVAMAVVAAVFLLITGRKRPKAMSPNERRFRNVFAMMTEERRQSLISYYSRKHGCGREEAMQRAVDDRARDEGRW
ncbi:MULTISPECIES: hypothetical protein [Mesorhizobium]|uniref:hypothetical protein n=1 Tax=Mesorhizobium TaxID=68287 RepID=UPI0012EB5AE9|nr:MULTISPECIES: hypothetical protein [Mesorhizobium]WJI40296.1 hypothetical protein NL534_08665 [Mesorhizobium opportunistum]